MAAEAVQVIVRCRPFNEREQKMACRPVISMDPSIGQVQLTKPNADDSSPPKLFSFDGVYFMNDTTRQIYDEICFPLVGSVLQGFNGTIFAYGQTGCGKSYTMMGVDDEDNRGVIPRVFYHVFDEIAVSEDTKFLVRASYLEIYNEEIRDLLAPGTKITKLELHEHPEKGVYVDGLSYHKMVNTRDLERIMELGSKNRSVGATLMNAESSRSHSIFTIDLEMMDIVNGEEKVRAGRLNLVDLAGSERQTKTGATGDRLREATKINLSLSALGNVISALVDGKSKHIPYRDSKLTRLLQSSLGGNTKTLMVACISPADNNYEETLSTLRYANRAKNIKNKPKINEDPKDALLREYQEEIKRLKMLLTGQGGMPLEMTGTNASEKPQDQANKEAIEAEKEAIRREYEGRIAEITSQYREEQSGRARLQQDLQRVQQEYEDKLAQATVAQATAAMETPQTQGEVAATFAGSSSPMVQQRVQLGPMGTSEATPRGTRESFSIGTDTEGLYGPMDQGGLGTQTTPPPLPGDTDTSLGSPAQVPIVDGAGTTPGASVSVTHGDPSITYSGAGVTSSATSPLTHPSSEEHLPAIGGKAPPPDDRVILREHEDALRKLEALQKEMIGGEKSDNDALKASLEERRHKADDRTQQLRKANEQLNMDDDGIIERIFNSLTDEVRVKSQLLERSHAKLKSAEEEIKDLAAEFELERQDFLDTIRNLQQTIKLQEQLLDTVVPCLRRDCNYYNIDKIKNEATWCEEEGRWALPQLTVSKSSLTSLAPVDSKTTLTKPSPKSSRQEAPNSGGLAPNGVLSPPKMAADDKFLHQLQKVDEPSYFKPKRAMELLGGKATSGPGEQGLGGAQPTPLAMAAAIHGVETQIMMDPGYSRRPSKLQALPVNVNVAQGLSPRNEQEELLEKMEKKVNNRKKLSLQPLQGTRKPPL